MVKRERSEAQKEAERRYREGRAQVLVRLTPDQARELDRARGTKTRAAYLISRALPRSR